MVQVGPCISISDKSFVIVVKFSTAETPQCTCCEFCDTLVKVVSFVTVLCCFSHLLQ